MEEEKGKKKKGGLIALIVVLVLLVGGLSFAVARLIQKDSAESSDEEEKRNVVVTPENVDSVLSEIEEQNQTVAPGYYTVTMNTTWHFKTGGEASYDAVVKNVEENTNDVFFDILLASDEEHAIYKSPVIPRGGELKNIQLDEALEAGTYDCVVVYHLVDEDQKTLSTLRVTLKIVIEG